MGLEMRAFLVRLEGGLVAEQFVEQKLRGIFPCLADQEQLGARFALRLWQKAAQDTGHLVGLSFAGFPLRDHQQAAALDGIADGSLVDCISIHGGCSFEILARLFDGYSSIYGEFFSWMLRC